MMDFVVCSDVRSLCCISPLTNATLWLQCILNGDTFCLTCGVDAQDNCCMCDFVLLRSGSMCLVCVCVS
jgi:hypothetical protein